MAGGPSVHAGARALVLSAERAPMSVRRRCGPCAMIEETRSTRIVEARHMFLAPLSVRDGLVGARVCVRIDHV